MATRATVPPPPGMVDPFASLGGGSYYGNGEWRPPGMAGPEGDDTAAPPPPPAAGTLSGDTRENPAAPPAPTRGPDPFASLGGGTPTADGLGWLPPGMSLPGGGTTPNPNAPPAAAAPTTPTTPTTDPKVPDPTRTDPTAPPPPATQNTVNQAFRDVLTHILTGPTPEQAGEGAATSGTANAYRTATQRSAERQQRQAAHLNAVQGGNANSPQLAMAGRGIEQQRGEDESNFVANLTESKIKDRRDELMQGLNMAMASGDADAARQIQLQIAEMNAALERSGQEITRTSVGNQFTLGQGDLDVRRTGLANQLTLGQGDLDLRSKLGQGDLDLRNKLGSGDLDLRRYGIDVGADTAMKELGLGYTQLGYQARRDALADAFG